MSDSAICDIYCTSKSTLGKDVPAVLQIERIGNSGRIDTLVIQKGHRKMIFKEGDKIRCLQGSVYVHVNPGSPAGGFHLKQQITSVQDGVRHDVALLTKDVIRPIHRGRMTVAKDIGNVLRGSTRAVR